MTENEYDPEIQAVIKRFISGEVSLRSNASTDPAKDRRNLPQKSQRSWANTHEEAVEKLKNKKAHEGNYYERLEQRGLNQKGDMDG